MRTTHEHFNHLLTAEEQRKAHLDGALKIFQGVNSLDLNNGSWEVNQ